MATTAARAGAASARRPLRVLRLCSVFEPPASAIGGDNAMFDPIGGMQEHTGSLTRVLSERGVSQVVVTARPPTAPWLERPDERTAVVRVALPVRRPRRLYSVPAAALAPLLGHAADIVHVHLGEDLAILPLAELAARPRNVPVVMTVHCSPSYTLRGRDPRTALLRSFGGLLERRGARRAAVTLVYTERMAGRLREHAGATSVRVMHRGVDHAAFAASSDGAFPDIPGRPRVVFIGRLVRQKGVRTLVEAAGRMRTPGAQMVIVGDGPDRAEVESLALRLGVAHRVHVTGFVPHERVPAVFASADVLVLPSLYEELGTVLVEAMHAGRPVVASRVDGIPEVVEDGVTGLLVAPGDAGALAQAVDRVLGDDALARRLAANAMSRAPDYDLERVGASVHELYEELAGPARRRAAGAGGPSATDAGRAPWPWSA
jgi:glycosyltransferase involved in cell wall biosynthesis